MDQILADSGPGFDVCPESRHIRPSGENGVCQDRHSHIPQAGSMSGSACDCRAAPASINPKGLGQVVLPAIREPSA